MKRLKNSFSLELELVEFSSSRMALVNGICIVLLVKFSYELCKADQQNPIVSTENGLLMGKRMLDIKNGSFYGFFKIPYAQPPITNLRFKPPLPAKSWSGIRNATEDMPECSQNKIFQIIGGQEDCLYLNLFTPQIGNMTDLKPVMIFIHGGAFIIGSGNYEYHGPEYLMTAEVVVITMNYRLGIFGFLNSKALGIDGNMGLKDQVLAFKWVQRNIVQFGGDPDRVTLVGHSAGAASVCFHLVSPGSRGLFQQAILQSGNGLNIWAYGQEETGMILAEQLNLYNRTSTKILDELYSLSTEEILYLQRSNKLNHIVRKKLFSAPIVEPTFLPDTFENLVRKGQMANVPILSGFTNSEGIFLEAFIEPRRETESFVPYDLEIPSPSELNDEIIKEIEDFYGIRHHNGISLGDDQEGSVNLITDIVIERGVQQGLRLMAAYGHEQIFMYKFSLNSSLNTVKETLYMQNYKGAAHGDENGYLFKSDISPDVIEPGSEEEIYINRIINIWTGFAKNSFPQDEFLCEQWKPIGNSLNYCEISSNSSCGQYPDKERMEFWDYIYHKYTHILNE